VYKMTVGPEGGVLLMERPALLVHGTCTIVPYDGLKSSALLSPKRSQQNNPNNPNSKGKLGALSPLADADTSASSSAFFGDSNVTSTDNSAPISAAVPSRLAVLQSEEAVEHCGPAMLRATNTRFEGTMIGSGGRYVIAYAEWQQ
jgi:hypothetical protein